MKKNLVIYAITLLCALLLPLNTVFAASGEVFASSNLSLTKTTENGQSVAIENQGDNTKIYLGANVTDGTMTEYHVKLTLENSNFKYKSFSKGSGWDGKVTASDDGKTLDVDFTSSTGLTGRSKTPIVTINLTVAEGTSSTDTCKIALSRVDTPTPSEPETPTNPKCQTQNGKYYDANGNEVTEEAYKASCQPKENPQTGSFLPYTVIIGGIVIAAGLYFITKKNNKIYHV